MTTSEDLISKGADPMFADLLAYLMNQQPENDITGMATGEALPTAEPHCECEDCVCGEANRWLP